MKKEISSFLAWLFVVGLSFHTLHTLHPIDFDVYYNASTMGVGEYNATSPPYQYCYPSWSIIFFYPMRFLEYSEAYRIHFALMAVSCWVILYQIGRIKYGWILFIPAVKILSWSLVSGNTYPFLLALVISPVGTFLAGLFKPHLFVFGGIYYLWDCLETRTTKAPRSNNPSVYALDTEHEGWG